jgi:hypothetical protein
MGGLYAVMEALSFRPGESSVLVQVGYLFSGRAGGHILLHAVTVWVIYMAIEPYVRRVWPRMLVGLIRLLSGRLRDPAVGREVLIGLVIGCGLIAILRTAIYAECRLQADDPGQLPYSIALECITTPARYISNRVHIAASAVLSAAVISGFLVVIRLLTRHTLAATLAGIVGIGFMGLWVITNYVSASIWLTIMYATGYGVAIVLVYTRVGILAGVVTLFMLWSTRIYTVDFDDWIAPFGIAEVAVLLALATYGFWVSLAGQPIFKDLLVEPAPA